MVRYLTKTGDLFQHIPKTGGTWIESFLLDMNIECSKWLTAQPSDYTMKHCLLGLYFRNKYLKINRVFSFVRHPIPYYESVWKWMTLSRLPRYWKRLSSKYKWHPHFTAMDLYHSTFGCWVENMLEFEPLWYTRLVEQYVGPENGEFCNYIGRTENLRSDFCGVLSWLGYEEKVEEFKHIIMNSNRINDVHMVLDWPNGLKGEVLKSERLFVKRFYGDNECKRFYAPVVGKRDIKSLD